MLCLVFKLKIRLVRIPVGMIRKANLKVFKVLWSRFFYLRLFKKSRG